MTRLSKKHFYLSNLRHVSFRYYSAQWASQKLPHLAPMMDVGYRCCEVHGRPRQFTDPVLNHLPQPILSHLPVLLLSVRSPASVSQFCPCFQKTQYTMFPCNFDFGASGWHSDALLWPCVLFLENIEFIQVENNNKLLPSCFKCTLLARS